MTELCTFGETMVRLSPPRGERLETATELDYRTAGAESNVAVTAANLGTAVTWLSKLPANPLGRRVVRDLRSNGVEASVAWDQGPTGRQGTYYLEIGGEPRGSQVVYDRRGSSVTTATPDELDLDRLEDASVFCTSGITPALSDTLLETTRELLERANRADTRTVLDVNYRSALWDETSAGEAIGGLLPLVDVVVSAERDARSVLGGDGDAEAIATELRARHDAELAVVTCGAEGAVAATEGAVHRQAAFEAETIDPIGTGDAFLGGFLAADLAGHSLPEALERAAATAALSRTMRGDWAVVSWADVDAVRRGEGGISR